MTTATGDMAIALDTAMTMIAKSATFRAAVGTSGAEATQQTQALSKVHPYGLPVEWEKSELSKDDLQAARPFWIVNYDGAGNGFGYRRIATGANSRVYGAYWRLTMWGEWDIPEMLNDNWPEIVTRFNNYLGGVMADLRDLAGQSDHLDINDLSIDLGPMRCDKNDLETEGDHMMAVLSIELDTLQGGGV